jgi:hypothetical protein
VVLPSSIFRFGAIVVHPPPYFKHYFGNLPEAPVCLRKFSLHRAKLGLSRQKQQGIRRRISDAHSNKSARKSNSHHSAAIFALYYFHSLFAHLFERGQIKEPKCVICGYSTLPCRS